MRNLRRMAVLRILMAALTLYTTTPGLRAAQQVQVTSYGQSDAQRTLLATQSGNATIVFEVRPGVTSHQLTYVVSPSVSALTVTVTGSATGPSGTFGACGNSSVLGDTITCTGTFSALKVAYTAFAGSGTVDATYFGTNSLAMSISGTVDVDVVANSIGLLEGVAQASTTANQEGALVMGAVSTSAPSHTNGQTDPLSMTLTGDLRAQVQGTDSDGATATGRPVRIAGKDGSGNAQDIATDTSGNLTLSPTTYNSTKPTYTNGQTATQYEINNRGGLMILGMLSTPFAATTISTTVQTALAAPGVFDNYHCFNPDPTTTNFAYIQFFNTTGAVTLGTTVPTHSIGIPAGPGGATNSDLRWYYDTGLKFAATTTASGASAPATALQCTFGLITVQP